jgi:hypothetical protein
VPCAAHRPWIGDRGHLASPPLAKPTQCPIRQIYPRSAFFRFSSVSPGWRRDRARRQQEDRDESRVPERALFELMSVQRGFVSRTNHSRTGISCERLIFSISISNLMLLRCSMWKRRYSSRSATILNRKSLSPAIRWHSTTCGSFLIASTKTPGTTAHAGSTTPETSEQIAMRRSCNATSWASGFGSMLFR